MDLPHVTAQQNAVLRAWGLHVSGVIADLSWPSATARVLRCELTNGEHIIVKAGDEFDTHVAREVRAYQRWLTPWSDAGVCPRFLGGDRSLKILVVAYVPGTLLLDQPERLTTEVHVEAGRLLRSLHGDGTPDDGNYLSTLAGNVRTWLTRTPTLPADMQEALDEHRKSWTRHPYPLVVTHGDYQPRNWLLDGTTLRVIDFGRATQRPAESDVTYLAQHEWAENPMLVAAFMRGYGDDLTTRPLWQMHRIAAAVGQLAWAYQESQRDQATGRSCPHTGRMHTACSRKAREHTADVEAAVAALRKVL